MLCQSPPPDNIVPADVAAETHPTQTWNEAVAFTQRVKELGPWQTQARVIGDMVDSVFTRNGWTSESDVFARGLILQTASLPPWDVRGRIDTFTRILSARYRLTPEQQDALRQRVWRDIITLTTRSFPAVLPTLGEMLETRAAGRPFTSQQVAGWVRTIRPLVNRNMSYMYESLDGFRATLTPSQQELLDRDVAAADRRAKTMFAQMNRWARGGWKPQDWGLDRDPIHAGGERSPSARRAPAVSPAQARRPRGDAGQRAPLASDHDQWEQYVQQFISRYELDPAQQSSAWSIYEDLKSRADQWRASHADELAELQAQANEGSDPQAREAARDRLDQSKQPLADMFAELKDRLANLLTSEQRARSAEPPDNDR